LPTTIYRFVCNFYNIQTLLLQNMYVKTIFSSLWNVFKNGNKSHRSGLKLPWGYKMHTRGSVGIFNWWVPKCCAFAKKGKKMLKLSNYWTSFDSFCKINGFENLFLKIDGFQEPIKPMLTEPLHSPLPDRKPIQILISTIQWKFLNFFFLSFFLRLLQT